MRFAPSFVFAAPCLALLASCVGPAPRAPSPVVAPPAPAPAPVLPASPAPVATEWLYRPVAPGVWTYQGDGTGSAARFGTSLTIPGPTIPSLTIRCDTATRRISIIRAGMAQGAMVVRTSYGAVTWPATAQTGPTPQTMAVRAASDATLDQIAYSRGKIAIELAGQAPLIVPAWPELARVIEDCRG